ncbi:MAG TPA: hypothetical protein VMQ50_11990 [Casimicrobiaceae bacterium]|nr:hypothetical protein [Casimicrobiaceae bacterium]
MPVIWTNIDSYQVKYITDSGFAGNVNACEIDCFNAGTFVARICLIKAGLALPTNAVHDGAPYLYYPLSQFGDIIGILRYQKPLSLDLDSDSLVGGLYSAADQVGAQYKK